MVAGGGAARCSSLEAEMYCRHTLGIAQVLVSQARGSGLRDYASVRSREFGSVRSSILLV